MASLEICATHTMRSSKSLPIPSNKSETQSPENVSREVLWEDLHTWLETSFFLPSPCIYSTILQLPSTYRLPISGLSCGHSMDSSTASSWLVSGCLHMRCVLFFVLFSGFLGGFRHCFRLMGSRVTLLTSRFSAVWPPNSIKHQTPERYRWLVDTLCPPCSVFLLEDLAWQAS